MGDDYMLQVLKMYAVTFIAFIVVDLVWLVFIAKNIYKEQLGFIMKSTPNWIAAGIFYLLFIAGLVFFVIYPGISKGSLVYTLLTGMFFGLITYATYDLTNLAVLEGWPLKITIIDIVWGTVLGGLTSLISFLVLAGTRV